MQYGLIRTAAVAPQMRVADPDFNAASATDAVRTAAEEGAQLVVLPRLFLTGSTCGSLYRTRSLTDKAEQALADFVRATAELDCITVVGLPVAYRGRVLDCAAAVCRGEIVGLTCACSPQEPFSEGVEGDRKSVV